MRRFVDFTQKDLRVMAVVNDDFTVTQAPDGDSRTTEFLKDYIRVTMENIKDTKKVWEYLEEHLTNGYSYFV